MLKYIGLLLMTIDHIGIVFFPDMAVLRYIGRLSMPIFAYYIAQGFYYTEKKKTTGKYALKLLVFSLISQVPYHFFISFYADNYSLNIGFTWLLSLLFLKIIADGKGVVSLGFSCALVFAAALVIPFQYGLYGVLFPLPYYLFFFKEQKLQYAFVFFTGLFALYAFLNSGNMIQVFALLAFPLIVCLRNQKTMIDFGKWFFYVYYPAHLAVMTIVERLLAQ